MDNPIVQLGINRAIKKLTVTEVRSIYDLLLNGKDYSHINNSHFITGLYSVPYIDKYKLTAQIKEELIKKLK